MIDGRVSCGIQAEPLRGAEGYRKDVGQYKMHTRTIAVKD